MYTAIRYIAIRYNCIIHTAAFGHVFWMFWDCFLDDWWCFLDDLVMFSEWFGDVFWMFWECFLDEFVMFSGTTRQPIFTRWGLMSVNTTFFNPTIKNFAHLLTPSDYLSDRSCRQDRPFDDLSSRSILLASPWPRSVRNCVRTSWPYIESRRTYFMSN